MRVVFMGTPDFAVPTLAAIVAAGHEVAAVYTQPPRPAGRGMGAREAPVQAWARGAGLPVLTPATLREADTQGAFAGHGADVAVVVAYGLILPRPVLEAPRHGCLNLHASALPRWRGAAPIQRAIMAGDEVTAATVMRMEAGLDTGPICRTVEVRIGPDTTAGELHDELARQGAGLMVNALADLARGALACVPQDTNGITYAAKIDPAETQIAFGPGARGVHDHIRALSPAPGAWFGVQAPREGAAKGVREERIKVLRSRLAEGSGAPGTVLEANGAFTVACGSGAIELLELQRPGRRPMPAGDVLRGFPIPAGTLLRGR